MSKHPLQTIEDHAPELFTLIGASRELSFKPGAIDPKNKYLIAMAIDVVKKAENGIKFLAERAMEHGATKEEIAEVLNIVYFITGVGPIYVAAEALEDILS